MANLGLDCYASDTDEPPEEPANQPTEGTAGGPTTALPAEVPPEEDVAMVTLPLPPLDIEYNTAEEAIQAINDFALDYGYAVVKRRSKRTKSKHGVGVLKKVQLMCDRGGIYTPLIPTLDRKRKTTILASGCLFDIAVRLRGDKWAQRRLELNRKDEKLQGWFRLSYPTRQIMTILKNEDQNTCLTQKDINNARLKSN
ncbi:hypothetical protein PEBR_07957 [Penicillium brasilianum]|uniref:FAR1 domain-containing protein n=1 Tax=Penicillium brasilianum TaxID=104259 RepID=A0A1S9RW43_PENBI|nr:hypothetical protein PEBR_07957 [Penicillium brasilianum]